MLCFAESLKTDITIESEDGREVQEVGCSTSSTISNEHLKKVAADAIDEIIDSTTSSSQLQDNVENKVLEGDSSLSTEKHSIPVEARLKIFTSFESSLIDSLYMMEMSTNLCSFVLLGAGSGDHGISFIWPIF